MVFINYIIVSKSLIVANLYQYKRVFTQSLQLPRPEPDKECERLDAQPRRIGIGVEQMLPVSIHSQALANVKADRLSKQVLFN